MNEGPSNSNRIQLLAAARELMPILDRIAFVGGCATGLLITDPAASPVRPTIDVDAIIEIATYADYVRLQSELEALGFNPSQDVICRWISERSIVDLMPTTAILGFTNRWYQLALRHATEVSIDDLKIRLISAPYFLATKLVAFRGRGRRNYVLSPDLEDIVSVTDGRPTIANEVAISDFELRGFLAEEFRLLLENEEFQQALPGYLAPDAASQLRKPLVLERMQQIAGAGGGIATP